ncbi:hypothetical protein DL505_20370 [Providencia stuartii]|nr:LexA family transcriptional regulator [Providencia stuartii]MDT2082981.1 LexA family transcriptional regulator [Providencia stuartii]TPW67328.1 hypothetical protein DL505_20370 [Providencia stuartii]
MNKPLTKTQGEVLSFIRSYIAENQYPPTRIEIASHFGYKSPNAAEEHLKALARKNAILVVKGISRGIRVL